MNRKFTMRYAFSIFVVLMPFLIIACSESGGSSSTEPFSDEPAIVDSAMCINIDKDRPDGITDTFLKSDDRIYVWLYWSNLASSSVVKTVWFKPGSDVQYLEDSQTVRSESGFGITWFYIDKPITGFSTGEWSVEIYLDGNFERSYLFSVSD
jgi:hypothetical protein